jgi:hypothetical protein
MEMYLVELPVFCVSMASDYCRICMQWRLLFGFFFQRASEVSRGVMMLGTFSFRGWLYSALCRWFHSNESCLAHMNVGR